MSPDKDYEQAKRNTMKKTSFEYLILEKASSGSERDQANYRMGLWVPTKHDGADANSQFRKFPSWYLPGSWMDTAGKELLCIYLFSNRYF